MKKILAAAGVLMLTSASAWALGGSEAPVFYTNMSETTAWENTTWRKYLDSLFLTFPTSSPNTIVTITYTDKNSRTYELSHASNAATKTVYYVPDEGRAIVLNVGDKLTVASTAKDKAAVIINTSTAD